MSCVRLPVTSHDPAVRARPTVGPEGLSRPFPPKTLGPRRPWPQSMSHVPCECCCVLCHRGTPVSSCGGRRYSGVSTSWVAPGGGLCVSMKLQDRSTPHSTWCVRISQRTSIIIKALMDARRFHLTSYSRVWCEIHIAALAARGFESESPRCARLVSDTHALGSSASHTRKVYARGLDLYPWCTQDPWPDRRSRFDGDREGSAGAGAAHHRHRHRQTRCQAHCRRRPPRPPHLHMHLRFPHAAQSPHRHS
jgi:hypothetical protein